MCSVLLKSQKLLVQMETYLKKKKKEQQQQCKDSHWLTLKKMKIPNPQRKRLSFFFSLSSHILTLKKD